MEEPKPKRTLGGMTPEEAKAQMEAAAAPVPIRTEHSVMEGLPAAKAERIASIYREVAELQRRVAAELQGRAEDAERYDALEEKAEQQAARVTELETELTSVRAQLATITATTEELRKEVAARDKQIEEIQQQHRTAAEQFEAHKSSLQEARTQLEARDTELSTRTSERDAEQATRAKLERELDEARKQHTEAFATRDSELAAIKTERDALKGDLEKARTELDTGRTKAKDLAAQLVKVGHELEAAGIIVMAPAEKPHRPQPPPMPPPPPTRAPPVEAILEVTEAKPTTSPLRTALLVVGGLLVGCVATFAIVKATSTESTAAADVATPPSAAAVAAPHPVEQPQEPGPAAGVEPTTPAPEPAPTATPTTESQAPTASTEPPKDDSARAASATDGVIVLPNGAAGHRVYVDGKEVDVKGSRATIACGKHDVKIGSHGAVRSFDVACGGETPIPADPTDR